LSFNVIEFGGSLSVKVITEFIDNGGNVLVAGSSSVGRFQIKIFIISHLYT